MKYTFEVKEISYGMIEVEANSMEEAEIVADKQYSMGNTVWKSGEYEITAEEKQPPMRTGDAR